MFRRRAVGKLGGIPDRAQGADTGRTRDEKTEAVQRAADLFAAIGEGHHGERSIGDSFQRTRGFGSSLDEKRSRYICGRGQDHPIARELFRPPVAFGPDRETALAFSYRADSDV